MFNRVWKPLLGYALAAAALVYVARHVGINGAAIIESLVLLDPGVIVLALVSFCAHVLVNSFAFAALSQAFGVRLPVGVLSRAWAGSLLAKYVPGGVWQIVGRGFLLEKFGVSVRITAVTGVAEQVISLAACVIFATAAYLLTQGLPVWSLLALAVIAGGAGWLGACVMRVIQPSMDRKRFILAIIVYAVALIPYAIGYLLLVPAQNAAAFLYALFGGTVVGVLAIPVPGGLGVREASAVLLLSSNDGGQVVAAMLVARFLLLVSDAVGTVFGLRSFSGSHINTRN